MSTKLSVQQLLHQGMSLYNQKDYRRAYDVFSKAKKLAPQNFDAVYLLAVCLNQLGRLEDAKKQFLNAIQLNPSHAEAINTLGNVLSKQGKLFSAIKMYRKSVKANANYLPAFLNLAQKLILAGQHAEAQQYLRRILEAEPNNTLALIAMADAYLGCNQFEDALEYLLRAQAISPENAYIEFRFIQICLSRCEFDEVEKNLSAYERKHGLSAEVAQLKAKYYFEAGKYNEAQIFIGNCLKAYDDQILMGLLLKLEGLKLPRPEFINYVSKAVETYESKPEYLLVALESLIDVEAYEQAKMFFEKLPKSITQQVEFLTLGAGIYENWPESWTLASRLAQRALDQQPENEVIATRLVRVLLKTAKVKKASEIVDIWRKNLPNSQFWLAYETTVLRVLDTEKYKQICNYNEMVQVYELETPIGYVSMESFNADLAQAITDLHIYEQTPLDQSVRLGTQSLRSLEFEKSPVIQKYIEALKVPIMAYIEHLKQFDHLQLGARITDGFNIQGCWSVRLSAGGRHVNHIHPDGWISSAYYVKTPKKSEIEKDGWIKFGEPPFVIEGGDGVERWIKPKAGQLVLFPSYFWHGVSPVISDEIRITAPFDLVPTLPACSL